VILVAAIESVRSLPWVDVDVVEYCESVGRREVETGWAKSNASQKMKRLHETIQSLLVDIGKIDEKLAQAIEGIK
jgi:hypothetical protein